jgi:hypothetical protein
MRYGSLKYAFLLRFDATVFASTTMSEIWLEDETRVVSRLDGIAVAIKDAFPWPLK